MDDWIFTPMPPEEAGGARGTFAALPRFAFFRRARRSYQRDLQRIAVGRMTIKAA